MPKSGKKGGKKKKDDDSAVDPTTEELPDSMDELDEAAAKIQAIQRGKAARKQTKALTIDLIMAAKPDEDRAKLEGMKASELRKLAKMDGVTEKQLEKVIVKAEDIEDGEAATKIQAAFRGRKDRKKAAAKKKMKERKEKKAQLIQDEIDIQAENDVSKFFKPGEGAYVRSGSDRGCTDCFCCLVFAGYWFGMCSLIYFATEYGELDRLVRPRDMNGNSCGMKTADVDLTEFPQLYLPNPSDETMQICTNGCPGSSKGKCNGAFVKNGAPFNYHVAAEWTEGVPKALVTFNRANDAAKVFSTDITPDPGQIPWLSNEGTCVHKGDCMEGRPSFTDPSGIAVSKDVTTDSCMIFGRCTNLTANNMPCDASGIACTYPNLPNPTNTGDIWKSSEKLACEGTSLTPTGAEYVPFEFEGYEWEFDETDDNLFICMPKEGCTFAACEDDNYPPDSFGAANSNRWLSQDGPCWMPVLPSEDYLFRCVPTLLTNTVESQAGGGGTSAEGQVSVQYMKDLQDYWRIIPFGAFVAVFAAFAWIIFLGKFAYYLIVGTCILTPIISLMISAMCFYKLGAIPTRSCDATSTAATPKIIEACMAADLSDTPEDMSYTGFALENCQLAASKGACTYTTGLYIEIPPEMQAAMDEANTSQEYTEIIAWGALALTVVLTLVFTIFWQRVMISVGVIEEASDAFLDVPFAVFLPIFVLAASLPVSIFCCIACFLLLSLRRVMEDGTVLVCLPYDGAVQEDGTPLDDASIPLAYEEQLYNSDCIFPTFLQGMMFAQVFGWLWTVQWFLSAQYCSIAGAISKWYFTPENPVTQEKRISSLLLSHSVWRTFRHHSGTMAFGSFIVAVVTCVKFALVYAINQVQAQSPENKLIKVLGNVLKVCISCVERFVRFVGHLAYIETAIYGNNFCHALYKAVKALARNIIRFSFVTAFSKLVLTLGKILVVVVAVGLANLSLDLLKTESADTSYCEDIGAAGAITGADCSADGKCLWDGELGTCGANSGKDLPNQQLPIVPLGLTAFFALTISLNIMGIYETAIDTIMVSFLEDESENDKTGGVTFAAGPLKEFMISTKSIANATEAYHNEIRDAKTNKIRANEEVEKDLRKSDLTPGGGHDALKAERKAERKGKKGKRKESQKNEAPEEKKKRKKKEKDGFNSASKGTK